ncbi:MAG: hypothetical protein CSA81_12900 [Acidobacteria bacterium]|nr:MAG: hypothetical protein CSA81_12900 [Acidobacteriota bacterium]PIE89117.1 MAG: hypothetical protein CR997_12640 [Acidobacteriota bacterium]
MFHKRIFLLFIFLPLITLNGFSFSCFQDETTISVPERNDAEDELIIKPGDLLDAKLQVEDQKVYVRITFTPKKMVEIEQWSEHNLGKSGKLTTANGQTLFEGKIQAKLTAPSTLIVFPNQEEAKKFCSYMMKK